MGNCFSSVFRRFNPRNHIVLLILTLDKVNENKSDGVSNENSYSNEFRAITVRQGKNLITIHDLNGHFKEIWPQYYSEIHGVIFIIDCSDSTRLDLSRTAIEDVLSHDKISGKPVLMLANEAHKETLCGSADILSKLNIELLVNKHECPTLVELFNSPTCASGTTRSMDPGLKKGYQWLVAYVERHYGDINARVQKDIQEDLARRQRMSNMNPVEMDIIKRTGFANPNYKTLNRQEVVKSNEGSSQEKPEDANSKANNKTAIGVQIQDCMHPVNEVSHLRQQFEMYSLEKKSRFNPRNVKTTRESPSIFHYEPKSKSLLRPSSTHFEEICLKKKDDTL